MVISTYKVKKSFDVSNHSALQSGVVVACVLIVSSMNLSGITGRPVPTEINVKNRI